MDLQPDMGTAGHPGISHRRPWRRALLREGLFLVPVLILFGSICSVEYVRTGGVTSEVFNEGFDFSIPVMLLDGRGFVSAAEAEIPALRQFLSKASPTLDLDALPGEIATKEPDYTQPMRAYVLFLVAGVWGLLGISWQNLLCVVLFFYLLTAAAGYALFRLTLPRWLSALLTGVFLIHPEILDAVNNLRDFPKTPFILGVLFLLGVVLKYRCTFKALAGIAAGLGLITAIGLGFRQDLVVCVPPALVVLLFCARLPGGLQPGRRVLAAVIYLLFLVVPALPVPWLYAEEGSEYPHNIIMGMTSACESRMGVRPASYAHVSFLYDPYVEMLPRFFYMREKDLPGLGDEAYRAAESEKRFVLAMASYFPGDAVTRGLASTLAILRGRIIGLWIFDWVSLFAAAVLVLYFFSRSLVLGYGFLFLVLYFGAYPSLQFETRHVFHFVLVPFWFIGTGFHGAWRLCRGRLEGYWAEQHGPARARLVAPRLACLGLSALLLGVLPYGWVQAVQRGRVGELLETYENAALEPLETTPFRRESVVLMRLEDPLPGNYGQGGVHGWNANYLMAEFKDVERATALELHYRSEASLFNFSATVDVNVVSVNGRTFDVRYFFPVFEFSSLADSKFLWGQFRGLLMTEELAPRFAGLYRVTNAGEMPLWLNIALPSIPEAFIAAQGILPGPGTPEDAEFLRSDQNPYARLRRLLAEAERSPEEREEILQEAIREWPERAQPLYRLALHYERQGQVNRAREYLLRAIAVRPNYEPAYAALLYRAKAARNVAAFLQLMDELSRRHAEAHAPHMFAGRAHESLGDLGAARRAYREALRRAPDHPYISSALHSLESRVPPTP